ncbi:MAG: Flp pilus assembly protein CpaB [Rhizobiaceae bacterium]|nr:Flp pilus assembly protein CpaB [Rhizobiaceae bacterium]
MKTAQLAVLGLAVAAAGGAGYIAMTMTAPQQVVQAAPEVQQMETEQVLVAIADVPMGGDVTGMVEWKDWPVEAIQQGFITKTAEPNAIEEIAGSVVRSPMLTGEPVRRAKLVGAGQSFMSSILPPGKRAVAMQVAADTSAGGFILPNDYVDIIMTRRQPASESGPEKFVTETVLTNIRVLAIDQAIQEDEEGRRVKVGETATLELDSDQVELLTVAQQMADRLTLALRSIADNTDKTGEDATHLMSGGSKNAIRMIKQGVVTEAAGGTR